MKMAKMYLRFVSDDYDFSDSAASSMFDYESTGSPIDSDQNGYFQGKRAMDITIAMWREDITSRLLTLHELLSDGYPWWFLERHKLT